MSYETIARSIEKENLQDILQAWIDMCTLGKEKYEKVSDFFELYYEELMDADCDTAYDVVSKSVYHYEFYRDWA